MTLPTSVAECKNAQSQEIKPVPSLSPNTGFMERIDQNSKLSRFYGIERIKIDTTVVDILKLEPSTQQIDKKGNGRYTNPSPGPSKKEELYQASRVVYSIQSYDAAL